MSVNVIVNLKSDPAKLAEFGDVIESVKTELPKAEGFISVDIYRNQEDESEFTLVEAWESQDHHANYIKSVAESGNWEELMSFLAGEPTRQYYSQV